MIEIPREMILRAQEGDEAAGRALVEALQRPVIGTIYRLLGPARPRDVEAIAEQVFLAMFRALPRFDDSCSSFTAWVYAFVRDHCSGLPDTHMASPASYQVDGDEGAHFELQHHQDVERAELGRRVVEALATLGEEQRTVFVLREYERLGYREIAAITGVHEGTVKSRLARAKASMRRQLQPYLETYA